MKEHRSTGLIVGGVIVAAVAALAVATGGTAIWADQTQRDENGYVSTSTHRYQWPTYAIATDKVTIGSQVPDWLVGKVRIETRSTKPVFVGIARKADVDAYLARSSYARATRLDLDPFRVTWVPHAGTANPGRPGDQPFWVASTTGSGSNVLTWKLKSGEWSVVLMNADGSPGVSASISGGAKLPWILWAGIGLASLGSLLAVAAAAMIYGGSKSKPDFPPATSPVAAV